MTTIDSPSKVLVNNKPVVVHLPLATSHFTSVNLLGMKFLKTFDATLIFDLYNNNYTISFGSSDQFDDLKRNDYESKYIIGEIFGFIIFILCLFFISREDLFSFFFNCSIRLFCNALQFFFLH